MPTVAPSASWNDSSCGDAIVSPKLVARLSLSLYSRERFDDRGRRGSTAFPFAVDRACDTTDPCRATSLETVRISSSTRRDGSLYVGQYSLCSSFLRARGALRLRLLYPGQDELPDWLPILTRDRRGASFSSWKKLRSFEWRRVENKCT